MSDPERGVIDNFHTPISIPITDNDLLKAPREIIRNQIPSSITLEDLFNQTPDELLKK